MGEVVAAKIPGCAAEEGLVSGATSRESRVGKARRRAGTCILSRRNTFRLQPHTLGPRHVLETTPIWGLQSGLGSCPSHPLFSTISHLLSTIPIHLKPVAIRMSWHWPSPLTAGVNPPSANLFPLFQYPAKSPAHGSGGGAMFTRVLTLELLPTATIITHVYHNSYDPGKQTLLRRWSSTPSSGEVSNSNNGGGLCSDAHTPTHQHRITDRTDLMRGRCAGQGYSWACSSRCPLNEPAMVPASLARFQRCIPLLCAAAVSGCRAAGLSPAIGSRNSSRSRLLTSNEAAKMLRPRGRTAVCVCSFIRRGHQKPCGNHPCPINIILFLTIIIMIHSHQVAPPPPRPPSIWPGPTKHRISHTTPLSAEEGAVIADLPRSMPRGNEACASSCHLRSRGVRYTADEYPISPIQSLFVAVPHSMSLCQSPHQAMGEIPFVPTVTDLEAPRLTTHPGPHGPSVLNDRFFCFFF
jgi:hypothetical protein